MKKAALLFLIACGVVLGEDAPAAPKPEPQITAEQANEYHLAQLEVQAAEKVLIEKQARRDKAIAAMVSACGHDVYTIPSGLGVSCKPATPPK